MLTALSVLLCFFTASNAASWSSGTVVSFSSSLGGFFPLSGEMFLVGNSLTNAVELHSTSSGNISLVSVPLPTEPSSVIGDLTTGTFWATPKSGNFVLTGSVLGTGVTSVPLPCSPVSIALGDGVLFGVGTGSNGFSNIIFAVDTTTHEVIGTLSSNTLTSPVILADAKNQFVIIYELGISGGGACMWRFDVTAVNGDSLSFNQTQGFTPGCGGSAALSGDSKHLVYPCNGLGTAGLCDLDPRNLLSAQGSFKYSGPYAFSSDSTLFADSSTPFNPGSNVGLNIFSVNRHVLLANLPLPNSPTNWGGYGPTFSSVSWSFDGSRVYLLVTGGFSSNLNWLVWWQQLQH